MTMKPCLDCGEVTETGPRCTGCRPTQKKPSSSRRGYDAAWTRLSKRARRMQPWCSDCGETEDLQADHSPEAWRRKAAGKAIRLVDVDVVCGDCNRKRGAARGAGVREDALDPSVKAGSATLSTSRDLGA